MTIPFDPTVLTPSQWQQYSDNARRALHQNPRDREALDAIRDAQNALGAYDQAAAASPGERIKAGLSGAAQGLGQAVTDIPMGLLQMATHPIQSLQALPQVPGAIARGISSDDPATVARTVGNVGSMLLPFAKTKPILGFASASRGGPAAAARATALAESPTVGATANRLFMAPFRAVGDVLERPRLANELTRLRIEALKRGTPLAEDAPPAPVAGGPAPAPVAVAPPAAVSAEDQLRAIAARNGITNPGDVEAFVRRGLTTPGMLPSPPAPVARATPPIFGGAPAEATATMPAVMQPPPAVTANPAVVGEARMPGMALHDINGNPIEGTVRPVSEMAPPRSPSAAYLAGRNDYLGLRVPSEAARQVTKIAFTPENQAQIVRSLGDAIEAGQGDQVIGLYQELQRMSQAGNASATAWRRLMGRAFVIR